jgi:hypothetical protein
MQGWSPDALTQPGRKVCDTIFSGEGGLAMLDEEVKQILIGSTAMIFFALALVYFQRM